MMSYNDVRFYLKTTESWMLFLAVYLFEKCYTQFCKRLISNLI